MVGLVIPTGYSFNLDGTCLYLATAAVFLAQATNTPLALAAADRAAADPALTPRARRASPARPSSCWRRRCRPTGTIPVTSVALVLGIHRLMSQGLTPTNLIGNAVATIAIAKWEGALDVERLKRVLDGEEPAAAAA